MGKARDWGRRVETCTGVHASPTFMPASGNETKSKAHWRGTVIRKRGCRASSDHRTPNKTKKKYKTAATAAQADDETS